MNVIVMQESFSRVKIDIEKINFWNRMALDSWGNIDKVLGESKRGK